MLDMNQLKRLVHSDKWPDGGKILRLDRLLMILEFANSPCQPKVIRDQCLNVGLVAAKHWNISNILKTSRGKAIRLPEGWELTEDGKRHLRDMGVDTDAPATKQLAKELRNRLSDIGDEKLRSFVEEAVRCYEHKIYRAAIVMSWVAAIAVLRDHVYKNCLEEFNSKAPTVCGDRWIPVKKMDDFIFIREFQFLEIARKINVFGNDVNEQLKRCLKNRNSCSHPNSLKLGQHTAASHIEILLLNVFNRFPEAHIC